MDQVYVGPGIILLASFQGIDRFHVPPHFIVSNTYRHGINFWMTGIEANRLLGICEHFLWFASCPKYVVDIRERNPRKRAVGVQRDRPLTVGNGLVVLVFQRLDPPTHRV